MKLIDRYVLGIFLRVFAICFISLSGMFVMGDFVGHIAEFVQNSPAGSHLIVTVGQFYAARIPWLFDILARIGSLIAAAFTIAWMQRNHELTALMAAGISRWRVLRPILAATIALALFAAAGRELWLPRLREPLGREARNMHGDQPKAVQPLRDQRTDILFGGRYTVAHERRIYQPNFVLPSRLAQYGTRLVAENARHLPAERHHLAGYLLYHVREPERLDRLPSLQLDNQPVILTPRDAPWLEPHMCFVVTDLPFELLDGGSSWRKLAPTRELISGSRNPSMGFGASELLTIHTRIVQPALDVVLVLLGLPLIIARGSRGILVSVGSCLFMVAVYYVGIALAHTLGLNLFLTPAMAAWLPLFIFIPLATGLSNY